MTQVAKKGLAGPRLVEYIMDVVLILSETADGTRLLWVTKKRLGSASKITFPLHNFCRPPSWDRDPRKTCAVSYNIKTLAKISKEVMPGIEQYILRCEVNMGAR